jgi:hypothetical protein
VSDIPTLAKKLENRSDPWDGRADLRPTTRDMSDPRDGHRVISRIAEKKWRQKAKAAIADRLLIRVLHRAI